MKILALICALAIVIVAGASIPILRANQSELLRVALVVVIGGLAVGAGVFLKRARQ